MCQSHYDKFCCPICGSSVYPLSPVGSDYEVLKTLQVIGAGRRLQKCQGCASNDRDRLCYLYLRDSLHLFDNGIHDIVMLHVAPENCIAQKLMTVQGMHYLPIDSFEHGYTYPAYIQQMDLLRLAIPDESVDWVICNHVLQDIEDDIAALREIYRVLRRSGRAILQVPISPLLDHILEYPGELTPDQCCQLYGQRFHKRVYNEKGYINRLESVGFEVTTYQCNQGISKYSLNPNEKLFIVTK